MLKVFKVLFSAAFLVYACPGLAQTNTANLPSAGPLTGSETLVGTQGSNTFKKITPAQIAAYVANSFQPSDADLTAIAALATQQTGRSLLTAVDAAAIRTIAGVGTLGVQNASAVAITGGTITGITDLALADGGTGASTAATARANLGLGTASIANTGTSGATVPLLNAANTWSAMQTFTGASQGTINFAQVGVGAPTGTTRSVGTKVVLYDGVSPSSVDYGIGVENSNVWFSVGGTDNGFKWYGGTSVAATLSGAGALTLTGGLKFGVATTPASATAACTAGTIQWDASYVYVCIATNSWKRTAIAAW